MRALPVKVRLFPSEAAASYFARLCAANLIPEHTMWRSLRLEYPRLGTAIRPSAVPGFVAALGGLPSDSFTRRSREYVSMCPHDPTLWVRSCAFCNGTYRGLESLCRRCTAGELVLVERLSGPICGKHARWHANGLDIDVSGRTTQLRAQRRLNRWLHLNDIGYRTALAAMARDVTNSWWHPRNKSVEQLSLSEEIAGLSRLVDVLEVLGSLRMTTVMDGHLPGRALAGILMRMSSGVARGLDAATLIASIDPGPYEEGIDRSLPEEQVRMLIARASTIKGALGRHRTSRAA